MAFPHKIKETDRSALFYEALVFVVFLLMAVVIRSEFHLSGLFNFVERSFLNVFIFLALGSAPAFILPGWSKFGESSKFIRIYIQGLAFILGLIFVLDRYDLYQDTWHLNIRLAILFSCLMIWRHPWFILMGMVSVQMAITGYFSVFDIYYVGHFNGLQLAMVYAAAIYFVHGLSNEMPTKRYIIALVSIHLGGYFLAGLTKLTYSPHLYEWITSNETWLFAYNTGLRGWQGLYEGFSNDAGNVIRKIPWLINPLVVLIEIFAVFALLSRRYFNYKLISLSIFHVIVFMISGVCFWIWTIHNLFLLFLSGKMKDVLIKRRALLRSVIYIVLFAATFRITWQVPYSWFDSRLQWFVTYEVQGADGESALFDRNHFGAYSEYFTQDYIKRTINTSLMTASGYHGPYAESQRSKAASLESIEQVRDELGTNYFEAGKRNLADYFLEEYFTHLNDHLDSKMKTGFIGSPQHLFMYRHGDRTYQYDFPVTEVKVRLYQYYFDGEAYRHLSDTVVHRIDLF